MREVRGGMTSDRSSDHNAARRGGGLLWDTGAPWREALVKRRPVFEHSRGNRVRDPLGGGMGGPDFGRLANLGEGIVSRVKILSVSILFFSKWF